MAGHSADYSAAKRVVLKAALRVVLMVGPSDALMVERRAGLLAGQMADPTVVTKAGHWALHLVDQMAAHSVDL